MTRIDATEARAHFSELTNKVAFGKERVIVQRGGKGLVAIVPVEDLELLEALEDQLDVEAARKALKERGRVPWEKFKAKRTL